MTKYSNKSSVSEETKTESLKIAKATQKPGQTKEQTKLIAQGIQKGIEQYKKAQKSKARELDKKLKKVRTTDTAQQSNPAGEAEPAMQRVDTANNSRLPWVLLVLSWTSFAVYVVLQGNG